MYQLEELITMVDELLSTKRKRHIIGGMLLSASFFFSGLAITVMSIKKEE